MFSRINRNDFFRKFDKAPHFYGNAAHAFYDVMTWVQQNQPKKQPNIVMPAYIPAKLYRFVLAAGYQPKFYDVTTELGFSLAEIENLIDDQTQMVFAVHFFGVPVDLKPLKQLTQEKKVFLFEDCAHTLDGSYHGKTLGTTGDFAIFSSRKMLQFHCGGFLFLNTTPWPFAPSSIERVSSLFTGYHLLGSRFKFSMNLWLKGHPLKKASTVPYHGYIDFNETQKVRVKKMCRLSEWYIANVDIQKVIKRRRDNVTWLLNNINNQDVFSPIGVHRLTESYKPGEKRTYRLINGYVPFSLPVLLLEGTRDQVQKKLLDAGIVCFAGWPEAPFGMSGYPGTSALKACLLELPVHQFINPHQLEIMARYFNESTLKTESALIAME